MSAELTYLAWSVVLALVYIFAPAGARNRETGLKYNAGPRDEAGPPVGVVTGRLRRAQANFLETWPLFAGVVLAAELADRTSDLTALGCALYVWARVAYLPLYAFGVPVLRSLVWTVSLVGMLMVLWPLLT